jgi:hypothetical protein
MKIQRLVNATITASGATASAICLTSIAICAGSTVAWFVQSTLAPAVHSPQMPLGVFLTV